MLCGRKPKYLEETLCMHKEKKCKQRSQNPTCTWDGPSLWRYWSLYRHVNVKMCMKVSLIQIQTKGNGAVTNEHRSTWRNITWCQFLLDHAAWILNLGLLCFCFRKYFLFHGNDLKTVFSWHSGGTSSCYTHTIAGFVVFSTRMPCAPIVV